ncbi:Protein CHLORORESPIRATORY REDUCTION 7 [Ranunculus cassubicifolius]
MRLYERHSSRKAKEKNVLNNLKGTQLHLGAYKPGDYLHKELNNSVCRAIRRRRSNVQTDTYVLIEPGKNEEFVSVEELKTKLKYWLENWPGNTLPPDLARYRDLDDAVSHLVNSVCELDIDGEVGSIQWYQVRLE